MSLGDVMLSYEKLDDILGGYENCFAWHFVGYAIWYTRSATCQLCGMLARRVDLIISFMILRLNKMYNTYVISKPEV